MKKNLLNSFAISILIIAFNISFSQTTWMQKADFGGTARYRAVGFSISTKGYIGTGDYKTDFWEWDQTTDTWTQKADCGGAGRDWATGFAIGNKGYIGMAQGYDFWEWDQASNVWSQKASYPGAGAINNPSYWFVGAIGFSIGSKGYIGTGECAGTYYNDFWEYDPSLDTWTQKANFGGMGRLGGAAFSIGTKGYIGTGQGSGVYNDFWEWDSQTNLWSQKANFGGAPRYSATAFSIGTKGYIGTGLNNGGNIRMSDFWEWDQATNTWLQMPDFAGGNRCRAIGFSIGNKGYIGTGTDSANSSSKDFWEFNPSCSVSPASICMVTVDSTNKNVVIWEKPLTSQPIDSFKIYREISSTYKHVGSVTFSSLSAFTDTTTGVNPNIASYKYEISVKDSCGNETLLSTFHRTIHVAMSPASPCGYNLIWNDYIGFSINQYLIYRDSARTGWKVVDSLSFGNTSWTDATCYSVSDTIAYLIEAINFNGCSPTMKSPMPQYSSTRSNIQQNYANPSYSDELVDKYNIHLFPNPFSSQSTIQVDSHFNEATLTISNLLGQTVKQIKHLSGQTVILHRNNLLSGLYFIQMTQADKIIATEKLLIVD